MLTEATFSSNFSNFPLFTLPQTVITAKYNPKTEHIASMVRSQKRGKPKPSSISRPPPPPPRNYNTRPYVPSGGYYNNYAKPNFSYTPCSYVSARPSQIDLYKKDQEDAKQAAKVEKLCKRLEDEIEIVRKQQEEQVRAQQNFEKLCLRHEQELQQRQRELLEEHRQQKAELQRQQARIDQQLKTLKEQQERGSKEQALATQKLEKECELLKNCQKEQEDLHRKEQELQVAKEKSKEEEELIEAKENSTTKMNGQAAAKQPMASRNNKQPLRPILGNNKPQYPGSAARNDSGAYSSFKRPLHPRVMHSGARPTGSSVNDRLKFNPPAVSPMTPPDSPENVKTNPSQEKEKLEDLVAVLPQSPQIKANSTTINTPPMSAKRPVNSFKFNPAYDAVSSLNLYCEALGYEKPVYNMFHNRPKFHCSVKVGGDVYSSYPQEFVDEETARQRTAEIAIERIKYLESRKHLSVCTLTDEEFLESLYNELLKYPHGILGNRLEQWYEETFKHHLPTHWYDLIVEFSRIRVEHGVNTSIIVFANPPGTKDVVRTFISTVMPELYLPWQSEDEHSKSQEWSMYITHCDSTQHVWVRLIDQSANFEELTEHMNNYMAVGPYRQSVPEPHEQEVYLVEVSDIWNRVRVLEVNKEQRTCLCHFVDFGDVASFEFAELHLCPPQFLVLPAQAICLSMYALDKFEDHPHAQEVLMRDLANQSVVARIMTTREQFQQLGSPTQGLMTKGKRRACLVATLYDTSTAEDIHLNDLVVSKITRNTPAPMLSPDQKSNPVLVSHINDMGDLMVIINNEDLKFVERSIANTVQGEQQHRVQYSDLLHDHLVFVCDESVEGMKQWYRGMLTAKPKSPEDESFDVYYVDDGRLRKTHISNIYRLEANNLALATYPPQALRVRLHDVPAIDGQMLGRLRGLMPPRSEVLLKVMEGAASEKLPMVNIYVRGQDPNSMYMCVNSAIRMEYEVISSTRLDPFDDGGLHFNPNGQLLRRSSLSSLVSSLSSASSSTDTPPVTPQKNNLVLKDYEAIPALGAYFEVRIPLSINPGHFAVQPYKCYNQFQRLMKELQVYCKANKESITSAQLAIGQAYAAPDSDGIYHRVLIHKIYGEIIHVRFVDVGDDGVVTCEQLQKLPINMREMPKMALPAQLYGIQLTDVVWSKENCRRFRELTLGQKFIGIVRGHNKVKDETRALCLELIDTSTPEDIKLHEILIKEKHAQTQTN